MRKYLVLFATGYVVAKCAALVCFSLQGCAGYQLTPKDDSELAQYGAELAACGKDEACKADIKAKWHKRFNEQFDGGF